MKRSSAQVICGGRIPVRVAGCDAGRASLKTISPGPPRFFTRGLRARLADSERDEPRGTDVRRSHQRPRREERGALRANHQPVEGQGDDAFHPPLRAARLRHLEIGKGEEARTQHRERLENGERKRQHCNHHRLGRYADGKRRRRSAGTLGRFGSSDSREFCSRVCLSGGVISRLRVPRTGGLERSCSHRSCRGQDAPSGQWKARRTFCAYSRFARRAASAVGACDSQLRALASRRKTRKPIELRDVHVSFIAVAACSTVRRSGFRKVRTGETAGAGC